MKTKLLVEYLDLTKNFSGKKATKKAARGCFEKMIH